MEVTAEQARKWADNCRDNLIEELDALIYSLTADRKRLEEKKFYAISGNPEVRLRQAYEQSNLSEAYDKLASWVEYKDKKES
jgi:hypothetical protein